MIVKRQSCRTTPTVNIVNHKSRMDV